MKILVVDDLRDNRALLQALLGSQGHEVLTASNGLEGLDVARASQPDLIISDVLMPEMDGFTLCQVLKGMKQLARVPFVFYTATYTEEADDRLGMALGASAYIHKPVEPEEFLNRIDQVVEASRHHDLPIVKGVKGARAEIDSLHHARVMNKLSDKVRSETRLIREHSSVLESVADGIVVVNADAVQSLVNHTAARMLGYETNELIGQSAYTTWLGGHAEGAPSSGVDPIGQAMHDGKPRDQVEGLFRKRSGQDAAVEYSVSPLFDEADGKVSGAVIVFRDIEERLRSEQRQRLTQRVFDSTTEGIVITDAETNIIEVNRAFCEITGYTREAAIGHKPSILKSGRHDELFYKNLWHSLNTVDRWHGEFWNRRSDGEIYPQLATINTIRNDAGEVDRYVAVFTDVSDAMHSQKRMEHLLHHDALTDLPNRTLLQDRIEQAIARNLRQNNSSAVILMDLDHFKNINESFGHSAGDQLLQMVAGRLLSQLRNADTVARIGGDEFVILLADIDPGNIATVLSRDLIALFDTPFEIDNQPIAVSVSLGVSLFPQDGDSATALLSNADAAVYRAKSEGRNNFRLYSQEMTDQAMERVVLAGDLHQAVNQGELYLQYQPQMNLANDRVVGVEALVRWRHPRRGTISPAQFIPIAEDSGLIHALGEWVLYEACRQAVDWMKRGVEFKRVAVNIAGPQVNRGDLPELIGTVLLETGLPAEHLELEVTEGFIMRHAEQAIEQLIEIRRLGVTLAIDDFGTGYSSLSYLKRLPLQKLKIDQSFVRDIPRNTNDQAIASAVIALGKSLELDVIAEGVENNPQVQFLKEHGCEEFQGYFFSHPLDAADLEAFIHALST
ncbi:MAG: EAL domain-containing protein [Candidatus Thiodiazotropha taylori]|nr:EAL domain-containing protein [Candidatus Thiodiazotropha taylori]